MKTRTIHLSFLKTLPHLKKVASFCVLPSGFSQLLLDFKMELNQLSYFIFISTLLPEVYRIISNSYITKDKATLKITEDFVFISPKGKKRPGGTLLTILDMQQISPVNVDSLEVEMQTKDVGIILPKLLLFSRRTAKR